jgi:hypothetical protein
MDRTVHFAKVFGIVSVIIMASYFAVIRLWGSSVGWVDQPPAPLWVIHFVFWAWPVIPAFLVAAVWELTRVAMLRRH